jgi:hypothetical protein
MWGERRSTNSGRERFRVSRLAVALSASPHRPRRLGRSVSRLFGSIGKLPHTPTRLSRPWSGFLLGCRRTLPVASPLHGSRHAIGSLSTGLPADSL